MELEREASRASDASPAKSFASDWDGGLVARRGGGRSPTSPAIAAGAATVAGVLRLAGGGPRPGGGELGDNRVFVDGPGEAEVGAAFTQVLHVIATLQERVQETEGIVVDLQAEADSFEEKRRLLARQAERAERDRDAAFLRCEEAEAAARRARLAAAPAVERFMEAEVLRSQMQVAGDELLRLREEAAICREELERGWPRLAEAEDAEAEAAAAIVELQGAHAEEVAVLTSCHTEELAELRAEHATCFAEIEDSKREELAALRAASAGELDGLKAALEAARWEAGVFRREHQDVIRETCLRQRENVRLAKRHWEARQEAMEFTARLEGLRAAAAGTPAREAELQSLRHRYVLLSRTAAEWGEALQRKRVDCEAWRRWAVQRGAAHSGEPVDMLEIGTIDAATTETPARRSPAATPTPGPGSRSALRNRLDFTAAKGDGRSPFTWGSTAIGSTGRPSTPGQPSSGPTPSRSQLQTPAQAPRGRVARGRQRPPVLSPPGGPPCEGPESVSSADGLSFVAWDSPSTASKGSTPVATRAPTQGRRRSGGLAESRSQPPAPVRARRRALGEEARPQAAALGAQWPPMAPPASGALGPWHPPALPPRRPPPSWQGEGRGGGQGSALPSPALALPSPALALALPLWAQVEEEPIPLARPRSAQTSQQPPRAQRSGAGGYPTRAVTAQALASREPATSAAAVEARKPEGPGEEFFAAVLRASRLQAKVDVVAWSGPANAGRSPMAADREADLGSKILEADNEVEMLAFLLDEAGAEEAARLLDEEVLRREDELLRRRPREGSSQERAVTEAAAVLQRLRAHLAELRIGRAAGQGAGILEGF